MRPMSTFVIVHVDGECCEGRAESVLHRGSAAPKGWRPAESCEGDVDDEGAPQFVEVLISPEDYARIVEPHRVEDTAAARIEALQFHIRRVLRELTRQYLERRVCALRGQYFPVPVVAAGWLNDVPTSRQWAEFEVGPNGVSVESLARAGLLKKTLGIWPPGPFGLAALNDTVDEFESVAWAPEFDRAKAQAVTPYLADLRAVEAELLRRDL